MAGKYKIGVYSNDEDDEFYSVKVQEETVFTANPVATGAAASFVRVNLSKRKVGFHTRHAVLSRVIGTGNDYDSARVYARLIIFTKTAFDALSIGQTLAYQGKNDWVVSSLVGESVR